MVNGTQQHDEGVALFDTDEIKVGRKLGSGGFCDVYEVQALRALVDTCDRYEVELSPGQRAARAVVSGRINSNPPTKEPSYAVKFLRPELSLNPKLLRAASKDLETETRILSQLHHPNIISIKGTSLSSLSLSEATESKKEHFLIMERLDETLSDRLYKWKVQAKRLNRGLASKLGLRRLKKKQLLVERLYVATEIASALEYLHGNRMIYRDLKPGNVGFDSSGRIKLFDFGLTRSLPEETDDCIDTFKMSGNCGTYRFMPPEVALKLPYNTTADVYSFSHLLWRMLTLERPYAGYSKELHRERVILGGERPPIDIKWSQGIQDIIESSWSSDIAERPSMTQVLFVLRQTIADLTGDTFILEQAYGQLKSCESMDTTVCSSGSESVVGQ